MGQALWYPNQTKIFQGKKKKNRTKYLYPPLIYTKTDLTKDLANKIQQYKK